MGSPRRGEEAVPVHQSLTWRATPQRFRTPSPCFSLVCSPKQRPSPLLVACRHALGMINRTRLPLIQTHRKKKKKKKKKQSEKKNITAWKHATWIQAHATCRARRARPIGRTPFRPRTAPRRAAHSERPHGPALAAHPASGSTGSTPPVALHRTTPLSGRRRPSGRT